jgi:hypothetical protein
MSITKDYLPYWKDGRLYLGSRLSGYSVVQDKRYPTMWRTRSPNGTLSDMVNRTRAKDAALAMFDRDLRVPASPTEARPLRKTA